MPADVMPFISSWNCTAALSKLPSMLPSKMKSLFANSTASFASCAGVFGRRRVSGWRRAARAAAGPAGTAAANAAVARRIEPEHGLLGRQQLDHRIESFRRLGRRSSRRPSTTAAEIRTKRARMLISPGEYMSSLTDGEIRPRGSSVEKRSHRLDLGIQTPI